MKKNIFKIMALGFLTLSAISCDDDIQNLKPYNTLDESNITSEQDFTNAIKGIYADYISSYYYGGQAFIVPDVASDNLIFNPVARRTQKSASEWIYTADTESYGVFYSGYIVVAQSNFVLSKLDRLAEGAFKDNVEAEAKANRAMAHFDIVRAYAPIPTEKAGAGAELAVPYIKAYDPFVLHERTLSVAEFYAEIITDLTDAAAKIGDNGVTRHGKASVNALLSRAYLYMGEYQNAVNAANVAIANGATVAPAADLAGVWNDTSNAGVLFKVDITVQDNRSIGTVYSQANDGKITAEYAVDYDFYNSFGADDARTDVWLATFPSSDGTLYNVCAKYLDNATAAQLPESDAKVLRGAEVYLNLAEAEFRLGNEAAAATALNVLRANRYAAAPDSPTGTDLEDAINLERRKEFAFEGDRFFTLKRQGKSVTRSTVNGEQADGSGTPPLNATLDAGDCNWSFPIPQHEIDKNPNMVQTTCYN